MIIRTTDLRATLALIGACTAITACAFVGLAHGAERGTLAVLRSMPVHVTDRGEDPEKRDERLSDIALRLWRGGRESCRRVVSDELQGAFDAYGTGGKCAPSKWSKARADHLRSIQGRL